MKERKQEAEAEAERPVPVHICTGCGRVSRRDDPDGIPESTGVFRCTRCGHEGPLNVHILDARDPRLHP
jgi:hypothetical protein